MDISLFPLNAGRSSGKLIKSAHWPRGGVTNNTSSVYAGEVLNKNQFQGT